MIKVYIKGKLANVFESLEDALLFIWACTKKHDLKPYDVHWVCDDPYDNEMLIKHAFTD